mgnify:CR=1 FL=1
MAQVKKWFVKVEWTDGEVSELFGGDLPDNVTHLLEQYIKEVELYETEQEEA